MIKVFLMAPNDPPTPEKGDYAVYFDAFLPAIPNKGDIFQIGEANKEIMYRVREVCYTQEPDRTFSVVVSLIKDAPADSQ